MKSGTGRIPEPKKEKHMGTYKSLEEAQEVFKGDRFATVNGMHIEM